MDGRRLLKWYGFEDVNDNLNPTITKRGNIIEQTLARHEDAGQHLTITASAYHVPLQVDPAARDEVRVALEYRGPSGDYTFFHRYWGTPNEWNTAGIEGTPGSVFLEDYLNLREVYAYDSREGKLFRTLIRSRGNFQWNPEHLFVLSSSDMIEFDSGVLKEFATFPGKMTYSLGIMVSENFDPGTANLSLMAFSNSFEGAIPPTYIGQALANYHLESGRRTSAITYSAVGNLPSYFFADAGVVLGESVSHWTQLLQEAQWLEREHGNKGPATRKPAHPMEARIPLH